MEFLETGVHFRGVTEKKRGSQEIWVQFEWDTEVKSEVLGSLGPFLG